MSWPSSSSVLDYIHTAGFNIVVLLLFTFCGLACSVIFSVQFNSVLCSASWSSVDLVNQSALCGVFCTVRSVWHKCVVRVFLQPYFVEFTYRGLFLESKPCDTQGKTVPMSWSKIFWMHIQIFLYNPMPGSSANGQKPETEFARSWKAWSSSGNGKCNF